MDFDLIKTIESDEEVPNYEENSDEEDDFQPRRQKRQETKDFNTGFEFISKASDYNKDTWDDVQKVYVKRKAKTKLDDKIKKIRKERELETAIKSDDENDSEDELETEKESKTEDVIHLSDDELKHDTFKTKEKREKKSKKNKKKKEEVEEEKMEFEECNDFDQASSFHQMNLSRPLLKAINTLNFTHPTPIQAATIPIALMGRDICGCAATGTGKTAAYMLPTLERLLYRPSDGSAKTRVLVLVPTRELGVQVYQVAKQLSQFTDLTIGLSVGGLDVKYQEAILRKSPDIVIATPGRLIDHVKNAPTFDLKDIEVLILDEADRMLDENFHEQMKYLIKQCSLTRQTILFSATMTEAVQDLVAVSLDKPVKVFVDNNQDVAFNLRQEFIRIRKEREGDREPIVAALICRTFHDHTMVFVQTKQQAHRLHILLGLLGVKVGELHGNLTQPQRLDNLRKFKDAEIDVLLATDVAARGLDIQGVKTVINFTMPPTMQHYIHRVGRTARAGRGGVSVSLAGENERNLVKDIIKQAKNPVKSRLIPIDIIEKYQTKLSALEPDVDRILSEEKAEREIAKLENRANRAEKLLKDEQQDNRSWFQTMKERKMEKDKNKLTQKEKKKKAKEESAPNIVDEKSKKPKKKEVKLDPAEERAQKELAKVAAYQARVMKKERKQKKIRCVNDDEFVPKGSVDKGSRKRSRSSFVDDLTNTSKKNVKRMRYEANSVQKEQGKNKFGKQMNKSKGGLKMGTKGGSKGEFKGSKSGLKMGTKGGSKGGFKGSKGGPKGGFKSKAKSTKKSFNKR